MGLDKPQGAVCRFCKPVGAWLDLKRRTAGAVQGHSHKTILLQGPQKVPHVEGAVAVGPSGDFVPKFCNQFRKKFPILGFRNQHVDVFILEAGGAGQQIPMPQAQDPRAVIRWSMEPDSEASDPEGGQNQENSGFQTGKLHVSKIEFSPPLEKEKGFTYIDPHNGDVPKLVRGGSAKALFISSSLIVASQKTPGSDSRSFSFDKLVFAPTFPSLKVIFYLQ